MRKALPLLVRGLNGRIGCVLIGAVLLMAALGVLWTPYNPVALDIPSRLQGPSWLHPMGTDQLGRDVLSRLLDGASASVAIALASVGVAVSAGLATGAVSAAIGGWTDRCVMAVVDAVMAFPSLLLALGIMTVFGPSTGGVIVALGIAFCPAVIRVTRGTVLSLREREFVEASVALGNQGWRTLWQHLLPNCIAPVTVLAASLFAAALLSESALSFLGLGVPPPSPTWGGMLAESRQFVGTAIWLALAPGIAISFALLGINLFGDALRDVLDPRMIGS